MPQKKARTAQGLKEHNKDWNTSDEEGAGAGRSEEEGAGSGGKEEAPRAAEAAAKRKRPATGIQGARGGAQ